MNLFHIVIDGAVSNLTTTVDIEHSNDGKNWVTKQASVYSSTAVAGQTISAVFSDVTNLSLGLVRLKMTGSAGASARVRIMACGRD